MSLKYYYARFFLFFVIYLGINLLIIKMKSSDYFYENVLKVLNNQKLNSRDVRRNVTVTEDKNQAVITGIEIGNNVKSLSCYLRENEKKMNLISKTCKENNLTSSLNKRHFLYSPNHNGVYCWIRKAGSTSFTKFFSEINNRKVNRNYYREIDFLTPKTDGLLMKLINDKNVFKLVVVRHPFERLVSAYRDRIEDNSKYTAQSWIFVPKIFHLTRPELFKSDGTIDKSLFKIFHQDKRLKLVPSFKEFVKWLLQQDSASDDPHWNQYYKHCALCSLRYNFVLKLDNYTTQDIDYIFTRMSLDKGKINLYNLEQTKKGHTNFEETCNYFKNLSHEAVVNLYEKYRIDFDMFDYDFDKYFECAEGD